MSLFDLHPYLEKIYLQTTEDPAIKKERDYISHFFENWIGEFLHPYGDALLDAGKLKNCFFYCYLSGQSTNFHWYAHSLYYGAYTIVFRELRCILEGLFIVFKIENLHFNTSLDEKLNILGLSEGKNSFYGKRVFQTSGFADWESYYQVYRELSGYIHFSYSKTAHTIKSISRGGFPEVLDYEYNQSKFLDAYRIWRKMSVLSIDMAIELAKRNNIRLSVSSEVFFL